MSEENTTGDAPTVTFHIKSSGNAKYTFTLPLTTTALELKTKLAAAEYANIAPESQRLIYSGRVLKDGDTLDTHKVKEGNTMHLVKSAPSNQRQNPANQGTSSAGQVPSAATGQATSGVPTNLASGTGNNPLAGLTGARYAGFAQLPGAGMFGPDGGMGPPPSADQMIDMLSNPQVAQMMNEALQNPQMVDMMIQQNPQLRAMGPQARQMLQSEQFRRMMTDPEALRSMAQLQQTMGLGGFGGAMGGQNEAFPAPGVTNTTSPENRGNAETNSQANTNTEQQNPFGAFGGMGGSNPFAALFNPAFAPQAQQPSSTSDTTSPTGQGTQQNTQQPANPFAALFNPALFGQTTAGADPNAQQPQPGQQAGYPFLPQNNPILNNPELFQQFMQAMQQGQASGATNPMQNLMAAFGGMGGMGGMGSPQPADNRPPEERYADQLRQLNDMGFYDFDRNVQALSRSGGSVQGAIEHLLGGS